MQHIGFMELEAGRLIWSETATEEQHILQVIKLAHITEAEPPFELVKCKLAAKQIALPIKLATQRISFTVVQITLLTLSAKIFL